MRRKLILWFALLIAGFLAGFVLQYPRSQRLQQELSALTKELESCHSSEELSQLRDTATMAYLEATQKNYGKAGEYSGEFFDQTQRIASSTEDPARLDVGGSGFPRRKGSDFDGERNRREREAL